MTVARRRFGNQMTVSAVPRVSCRRVVSLTCGFGASAILSAAFNVGLSASYGSNTNSGLPPCSGASAK